MFGDNNVHNGEGPSRRYASTAAWKGRNYTFQLSKSSRFVIRMSVHHCDEDTTKTPVGYLKGYLIQRPSPYFFESADEVSQEMQELSCIFGESNGVASRVKHPKLTPDAVRQGGFFNIETVEVKPDFQGCDLGLRIIHEALALLRNQWTLAVIVPCALALSHCKWNANARQTGPASGSNFTPEELETIDQNNKTVVRYFARMGFTQAGRKSGQTHAWFLTAETYYGGHQQRDPIASWLDKQQTETLVIHEPPKKVENTGLDNELKETVLSFPSDGNEFRLPAAPSSTQETREAQAASIRKMEDLVRRGANVNQSGVLQSAAAKNNNLTVLQTLLRLGGNVNYQDELGNSPLHVAAARQKFKSIEYLMSVGANPNATNSDGETPLQCLRNTLQSHQDVGAEFDFQSMPVSEIDVVPKLQCLQLFVPPATRSLLLIDCWMSPRMKEVLHTTAELEMGGILQDCDVRFQRGVATPLSECCCYCGIPRIEYIPADVLNSPVNRNGLFASFKDGLGYIWTAIHAVLTAGLTPTVRRVEQYLLSGQHLGYDFDIRKYQHFLDKGGKVEFAVDALINITRNVVVSGDDGWEYSDFADDIDALPSTPLDDAFDIVRFKCINQGGGEGTRRGPYQGTQRMALSDDDAEEGFDESMDSGDY